MAPENAPPSGFRFRPVNLHGCSINEIWPQPWSMALPLLNELLNLSSISCSLFPPPSTVASLSFEFTLYMSKLRLPKICPCSGHLPTNTFSKRATHCFFLFLSMSYQVRKWHFSLLLAHSSEELRLHPHQQLNLKIVGTLWACVEHGTPWLSTGLPFWKQNLNPLPVSGYHKVEAVFAFLSQYPSISSVSF